MTHEFKKIVQAYEKALKNGKFTVLATVVHLEGSSYRKPGVRMLILEDGHMVGAVSGGCVEKEVYRQAASVFTTKKPKMMTYDGRYRLGCEGILYILIEPFAPTSDFLEIFKRTMQHRAHFTIGSYFQLQEGTTDGLGTHVQFQDKSMPVHPMNKRQSELRVFEERMKPCYKLMIIGTEHDAVQLSSCAAFMGWEVGIVATPMEAKEVTDFIGAEELITALPEALDCSAIDAQTAVVVMTHSYAKDLKYMLQLREAKPLYLGLLGPAKRREKILAAIMEHDPDVALEFVESIHGPAGINIGAETPQEIAIAIIAEILSVIRKQTPMMLKDKKGGIHD
ncbi:XdhC family protein [Arenibacter sp. GZD96]|uniref:XdhC family protein n=1 Tax=Aurantibrevibacter litoralis TaxID=3106030 RepID=UPI002AFE9223|nr:XdhC family protein [Arenibacter sp. GZD-96]MEA1785347.1 XdhC family protein [Arenibacter sp. GZD-96]